MDCWIVADGPSPEPLIHPTPVPFAVAVTFFAATGVGNHARAIDTRTGEDVTSSVLCVAGLHTCVDLDNFNPADHVGEFIGSAL